MIYVYEAKEYLESDRLNQSTLKDIVGGLDSFLATQNKKEQTKNVEKSHFVKGSLVDVLLTGTQEDFEQQFHITTLEDKPSDKEMLMCKDIVAIYFDVKKLAEKEYQTALADINVSRMYVDDLEKRCVTLNVTDDMIHTVINQHEWQPKWKTETRINKIKETCQPYLRELIFSEGKQVISIAEYDLAKSIVNSLKTNVNTAQYFDGRYENDVHVDLHFQLPIYFEMDGVESKGLLDLVVVILNENGVVLSIQPFDIKTLADYAINFPNNLKRFRYDIQAAWYTDGLQLSYLDVFNYEAYSEELEWLPFTFIVESTIKPGQPLLFVATDELLNIGRFGRKPVFVNNIVTDYFEDSDPSENAVVVTGISGYTSLLNKYKYYAETNWQTERIVAETNGVLSVNWNGIVYPIY